MTVGGWKGTWLVALGLRYGYAEVVDPVRPTHVLEQ